MSRITGSEARGMMEAYAAVYASQELTEEQVWEEVENWVNSLLEEGHDLSEYTWEEMYEEYLNELSNLAAGGGQAAISKLTQQGVSPIEAKVRVSRAGEGELKRQSSASATNKSLQSGKSVSVNTSAGSGLLGRLGLQQQQGKLNSKGELEVRGTNSNFAQDKTIRLGGRGYNRLTAADGSVKYVPGKASEPLKLQSKPAARSGRLDDPIAGKGPGGNEVGSRPPKPPVDAGAGSGAPAKPAAGAPAAAKTAPTRPAAPAKPTGSAMDQWASTPANKKLAAAAAEKARIRGTAQTDNPMIDKGMRSRMQVTPTVQSPAVAKLGAGNQSLTQNKFAGQSPTPPVKAATPSQAVAATTKPVAPEVKATNTIAAKPSSAMSQDAIRKQRLNMEMEYDAYDLVLEYLLSNGHVETVEEAHYVMLEMEAEVIQDIVEETRRTEYLQKKFNRENRRKSGSAHTAIPGKQNTGQALQKARESERHMSGDN